MRDLVQEFAVDIIASRPTKSRTPREDAERLVTADILRAKEIGDRPFYVDHFCDWRGRAYGVQRLNYQRQDHVRSLFRFERGKPLCADQVEIIADRDRFLRGEDWYGGAVVGSPLHWLEIHVANSYGEVDKMPMRDRLKWVDGQRDTIKKIARDPFGTKELWIGAEKKFAFVAACCELTAAMEDPRHFETCLPIGFDGACNGIQHLALLCRDEETARRVSLVDDNDVIHDIYGEVASLVRAQINVDDDEWAEYWRNEFKKFKDREIRKLFKQPVMTLPYGVTEEGAVQQIVEDYFELLNKYNRRCPVVLDAKGRPIGGRYGYLAKKIMAVAADLMPKPMQVMEFIEKLSAHFALQNLSLEWISPTGFPATNRYYAPDVKEVALFHGGERIRRHDVARGYLPTVMIDEATRSAAPNFIHSMDAAHLVRVVNAAAEEDIETACVHDSFSCLAPDADRFNKIIRSQLAMLYVRQDHLRALRDYSAVRHSSINLSLSALRKLKLANFAKAHPLPAYGSHDPITVQDAKYCWA